MESAIKLVHSRDAQPRSVDVAAKGTKRIPTAVVISLTIHAVIALILSLVVVSQREAIELPFSVDLFPTLPDAERRAPVLRRIPTPTRQTNAAALTTTDVEWTARANPTSPGQIDTGVVVSNDGASALVEAHTELPKEAPRVTEAHRAPVRDIKITQPLLSGSPAFMGVETAPDEALPGLASILLGNGQVEGATEPTPEYWAEIQKRIQKNQTYPRFARESGAQGSTTVRFVLERDGGLVSAEVAVSSGYKELDEAAVRSIRSSAPFPPFPTGQRGDALTLLVPILFELE